MPARDDRGRFVKGSGARSALLRSGNVAKVQINVEVDGVSSLVSRLKNWTASVRKRMKAELILIGNAWVTEAKKRVPVKTGLLRNSINKNVTVNKDLFELAVGSNRRYAPFVEFGTRHIAGGAVQRLGTGPIITDSQAVKTWPALEARGGTNQQMPWLRPSWQAIRERALARMNDALQIPKE